ncbi:MAG: ScyD/ScyE family protein [Williamsia sp.]|nr:ScyD/ScyE family protein [Williamsia sp.]
MKHLLQKTPTLRKLALYCALAAGTFVFAPGCTKEDNAVAVSSVTPVASGFKGPIGLELKDGWVWVGQSGTGANDGKVSAISPGGTLYDVITGFESVISPEGDGDGPTHLLFANDSLYILGTGGKMYIVAQSALNPGVTTLNASSLKVQNIGAFVLAYPFVNNAHDSHPYNFAIGPNGAMYITDAAANAILRREKNGELSVVAEIPDYKNPTPIGPPTVQRVPTGIYYDGQDFFITTLTGFPFLNDSAKIFKLTPPASGMATATVYQSGFTTLVDIAKGTAAAGKVVLEHGKFNPAAGWVDNTGRLLWANGTSISVIADGLNQPGGLKQADEHTWYVTSFKDNTVLKITN